MIFPKKASLDYLRDFSKKKGMKLYKNEEDNIFMRGKDFHVTYLMDSNEICNRISVKVYERSDIK